MALERIVAARAKKLAEEQGYTILDVRSVREYREGHPEGAFNVPYLEEGRHGMVPNEHFIDVVRAAFPNQETKLITSCQMGGRSVRAANELMQLGYKNVLDLRGGFGSEKDEAGNVLVPGWRDSALPVEGGEPAGRAYSALKAKAGVSEPAESEPDRASGDHGHGHGHGPSHGGGGRGAAWMRFAHPSAKVMCIRHGQELPALKRAPMGGELGQRLKAQVSAMAWAEWVEHSTLLINEYRLNPADPRAQQILLEQCEAFFFGEGAKRPDEFVALGGGH
ncbi:MAG: oxidative damage protection protein [Deltaproteobacteria bacterium]|nr:oxidative damage protection protein [Deltaproteobacteria bacterium]